VTLEIVKLVQLIRLNPLFRVESRDGTTSFLIIVKTNCYVIAGSRIGILARLYFKVYGDVTTIRDSTGFISCTTFHGVAPCTLIPIAGVAAIVLDQTRIRVSIWSSSVLMRALSIPGLTLFTTFCCTFSATIFFLRSPCAAALVC